MSYVSEFVNNLDNEVMKLGLNPKFKENPAYSKVLDEILYYIYGMNMANDMDRVWVMESNNTYSFQYRNPNVVKNYDLQIWISDDKNELFCSEIIESRKRDENTKEYIEKVVEVTSAKLVGDCIEIRKDHGTADNLNCERGKYNTLCTSLRKKYNKYGVQEVEEIESFNPSHLYGNIDLIKPSDVITTTSLAFRDMPYWKRKITVRRRYLDVVDITLEDKNTGEKFIGNQELNNEHGLQDLQYSVFNLSEHQVIHPLMNAEIEKMLEKEDPKVAEGLRRYAEGRDSFSYDSENSKECLHRTSQI